MSNLVVVAMSGGVDSSVAAALLVQQGYRVVGITLDLWPRKLSTEADNTRRSICCSVESVEDARRVADRLGFPHYSLNFRALFDRMVVQNFMSEYTRGRTPNPCVRCNRFIKFDALLNKARALGARYMATGHYARVGQASGGRHSLLKARNKSKDQSYALYALTQDQLAHTLFPLGDLEKTETRGIAEELGLVTAKKPESQELCFIPDDDYPAFLRQNAPGAAQSGPILNRGGDILGSHQGIAFFTVGQRKGLGIATGEPLFVVEIDPRQNAVIVGKQEELYSRGLEADDVNWVSMDAPAEPIRVEARIRYRASAVPAVARVEADGRLRVQFDEPQRSISPGQAVVLYDGDAVVAGGTIVRANSD